MGRVPLKEKPDFTILTNEQLQKTVDGIQACLFVYSYDKEKCALLESMLKELSKERTDRICDGKLTFPASAADEFPKSKITKQKKEDHAPTIHKIRRVKLKI